MAGKPKVDKPVNKLEAEKVTGPTPNPGNESGFSTVPGRAPQRAEKLTNTGKGEVHAPVTEKVTGEKIGRTPAEKPSMKPSTEFRFQHVVLPVGPDGDINPGPDSAAITAAIAEGWRPTGEAKAEKVADHPDGVSKIVTWVVPVVEASSGEYLEAEV